VTPDERQEIICLVAASDEKNPRPFSAVGIRRNRQSYRQAPAAPSATTTTTSRLACRKLRFTPHTRIHRQLLRQAQKQGRRNSGIVKGSGLTRLRQFRQAGTPKSEIDSRSRFEKALHSSLGLLKSIP